jgi:hypothetical protein
MLCTLDHCAVPFPDLGRVTKFLNGRWKAMRAMRRPHENRIDNESFQRRIFPKEGRPRATENSRADGLAA